MDDALHVGGLQGRRDLPDQLQDVGQRHLATEPRQSLAQRVAFEQLHHDVGRAVGHLTEVRHLHEPWMVHQVDRARLVDKAHRHVGILGKLRV